MLGLISSTTKMKFCLLFAAFLAAASAVSYEDVLFQEFNLFKAEYQKSYENPLENSRRMEIFLKTKYEVAQHNLRYKNGEETYEMEVNEFADWLPEEIAMLTGHNKDLRDRAAAGEEVVFPESHGDIFETFNGTVPDTFNWLEKGAVTPVKAQGACGSCYAFAAVGALESQVYIKTKKMVRLSEQQIVDCSGKHGNWGCNGGNAFSTYKYIKEAGGINTEESYPYEGRVGKCRYNKNNNGAACLGYVEIPSNEEALKTAVANIGPVYVAINCIQSFTNYRSGVYFDPNCKSVPEALNHAVLVVGYGTDPQTKQDYWLVKNSWGPRWGDKGYIKMARNKNNMCGITLNAVYPKV